MSASGAFPAAAGTSSSKAGAPAPAASGQSVNKRLQSELMSLMMGGDAGISAFPDGDNIFQWTGTITGGAGTVRRCEASRSAAALLRTHATLLHRAR